MRNINRSPQSGRSTCATFCSERSRPSPYTERLNASLNIDRNSRSPQLERQNRSPNQERIDQISLNIGEFTNNLSQDWDWRIDTVNSKIETIWLKHLKSHQAIASKYDELKDEIWSIKAWIEDTNKARETYIRDQVATAKQMEDLFPAIIENERDAIKEMETQIQRQIMDRQVNLRSDILYEFKNGFRKLEEVHQEVAASLGPLDKTIEYSKNQIPQAEQSIVGYLNQQMGDLSNLIQIEKSSSEDTKMSLMKNLNNLVSSIEVGIDNERKDRQFSQEYLLNLLETT